ncbi:hypothetical protein [Lysinibacillus piscis]|uniref:DUF3899 domain-containing protein n=1 Tax=Lysinibacillus piscis TaxID=2518931 RepID=A0ABQ5NKZ8_9BACI|nr:hypothetical protein [Lysinibacillus sp. KH24]GLC88964.1 hypothetical protein LYSBPC_20910 [Lysinibacillus sp. KH24]
MNKKNLLIGLLTIAVESAISYAVASYFNVRFIEVMFFIGFACACIIFYFSSGGGWTSRYSSVQASAQTGIMQKRESFTYRVGPVFLASALFSAIGLVFFLLLITEVIPPRI